MDVEFYHRSFEDLTLMELHDLMWLRNEVFVFGQKITDEPEVDGLDPQCVHVIGRRISDGKVIATARIFMNEDPVKVGRVAVDNTLQAGGIGTRLMEHVHQVIGERNAALSAQDYLRRWYTRLGWVADSDVYDEAGIPHVHMVRPSAG